MRTHRAFSLLPRGQLGGTAPSATFAPCCAHRTHPPADTPPSIPRKIARNLFFCFSRFPRKGSAVTSPQRTPETVSAGRGGRQHRPTPPSAPRPAPSPRPTHRPPIPRTHQSTGNPKDMPPTGNPSVLPHAVKSPRTATSHECPGNCRVPWIPRKRPRPWMPRNLPQATKPPSPDGRTWACDLPASRPRSSPREQTPPRPET